MSPKDLTLHCSPHSQQHLACKRLGCGVTEHTFRICGTYTCAWGVFKKETHSESLGKCWTHTDAGVWHTVLAEWVLVFTLIIEALLLYTRKSTSGKAQCPTQLCDPESEISLQHMHLKHYTSVNFNNYALCSCVFFPLPIVTLAPVIQSNIWLSLLCLFSWCAFYVSIWISSALMHIQNDFFVYFSAGLFIYANRWTNHESKWKLSLNVIHQWLIKTISTPDPQLADWLVDPKGSAEPHWYRGPPPSDENNSPYLSACQKDIVEVSELAIGYSLHPISFVYICQTDTIQYDERAITSSWLHCNHGCTSSYHWITLISKKT